MFVWLTKNSLITVQQNTRPHTNQAFPDRKSNTCSQDSAADLQDKCQQVKAADPVQPNINTVRGRTSSFKERPSPASFGGPLELPPFNFLLKTMKCFNYNFLYTKNSIVLSTGSSKLGLATSLTGAVLHHIKRHIWKGVHALDTTHFVILKHNDVKET